MCGGFTDPVVPSAREFAEPRGRCRNCSETTVSSGSYTYLAMDYLELILFAHLCARHARAIGTEDEIASTLWRMAGVYRAAAAAFGNAPDIGEPPSRLRRK